MNALTSLFTNTLPRPQNRTNAMSELSRPSRRERDYGIGYGSSRGYAKTPRHSNSWTAPRFRFV
ncbi:hypothetical protein [Cognatilysobacter bugurensis]|nr:hypothetical protein [Lysobacter bugurensis]